MTTIETGTKDLLAENIDGVGVITLNRPDARNAMSGEMNAALSHTLAAWELDPAIKCIVLTGAGKGFCAGGDVKGMAASGDGTVGDNTIDGAIHAQRVMQRATAGKLFKMPKPTIAALPGAAAGAALVAHPLVRHVTFTGSVATGGRVMQAAARNVASVTLELGGKSPAVVLADCDMAHAVGDVLWSIFYNAGQTCWWCVGCRWPNVVSLWRRAWCRGPKCRCGLALRAGARAQSTGCIGVAMPVMAGDVRVFK